MDYLGGPKMPSQVLLLERKREISHSQKRRKQCDHGSRDWSDVATSQGALYRCQKLEKNKVTSQKSPWRD